MIPNSARKLAYEFVKLSDIEWKAKVKSLAQSASSVRPGDLLAFKYPKEDNHSRISLIVSCDRGLLGYFISTRGNMLISCFKIEQIGSVTNEIIKNLYKNRSKASYHSIKRSLTTLLGTSAYRTYILNHMSELHAIEYATK